MYYTIKNTIYNLRCMYVATFSVKDHHIPHISEVLHLPFWFIAATAITAVSHHRSRSRNDPLGEEMRSDQEWSAVEAKQYCVLNIS